MKKLVHYILEILTAVEVIAVRLGLLLITLAGLFAFIRHALGW